MNIQKLLWYWGPPIALMSIIFYLSSRQSIAVSDEFTVNFIVFKSLHLIEYALLFFLLFRAYYSTLSRNNMKRIFLYAIVTALLYAISDEMHQTLVPTRTGQVRDILIDSIGILLCFQYTKMYLSSLKRLL